MPGMPSCRGSEHKGRFDGERQRYEKNFDTINWSDLDRKDMIDTVVDNEKPVPGDPICATCRGVVTPQHCTRCDPFTHNFWRALDGSCLV